MTGKGFTNDAIPALSACESPIEGKFAQAFFDMAKEQGRSFFYRSHERGARISVVFSNADEEPKDVELELFLQVSLDDDTPVRVDAVINVCSAVDSVPVATNLVVELDGEAYHSSVEQVKRDRVRDRRMLLGGVPTIRFSGDEVFRNPARAAKEALDVAMAHHHEATKMAWNIVRDFWTNPTWPRPAAVNADDAGLTTGTSP